VAGLPRELRRKLFTSMAAEIAEQVESKGLTEEEI
jgi:hypothetical protein